MGEDLRLPNIATWWCGQQAERARSSPTWTTSPSAAPLATRAALPSQPASSALAYRPTRRAADLRDRRTRDRLSSVRRSSICRRRRCCDDGRLSRAPSCCASMRRERKTAGGHAGRLLPHLRPRRRARRVDGRGRAIGRCLGARRQAGRDGHACCRPTRRSESAASWAICRAGPPTISSGSGAISNAPRRPCG